MCASPFCQPHHAATHPRSWTRTVRAGSHHGLGREGTWDVVACQCLCYLTCERFFCTILSRFLAFLRLPYLKRFQLHQQPR